MASQYSRGRDTEYKCIEELERAGYRCTRAASSKGNWDVIGVCPDRLLLVSCKRAKNERLAKRHLTSERRRLQLIRTPTAVRQEIWVWLDGQGWLYQEPVDEDSLGAVFGQIYGPALAALRDDAKKLLTATPQTIQFN